MPTSASIEPLVLPTPPADEAAVLDAGGVACWSGDVRMRTYEPAEPDRFPAFFDRRVYQGSDGRVYPLPFTDRIAAEGVDRDWRAVVVENRWLRVVVLPALGGRIHAVLDKTSGADLFYRNGVIKPALVGLAGPWVSGGVEFNWPQHHRPGTYLPVETSVQRDDDGTVTVWQGDVDPLQRMRGTHGVRLRPDSAALEVVARLQNRTDEPQSFLWWANVATEAHAHYRSFFPDDVRHVADHARRAITAFPTADRPYYGVDYPNRASARLDDYADIPVPTSYMVTGTADPFFGGYDHAAGVGFVHWADHDLSPGKKQWTWGHGELGRAWDRQLSDDGRPYLELMAGVFTDNQPDFSWLAPGETRTFAQRWFPIHAIGAPQQASRDAALSVEVAEGELRLGVAASRIAEGELLVVLPGREHRLPVRLEPGRPVQRSLPAPGVASRDDVRVELLVDGAPVLVWARHDEQPTPWSATAPPEPAAIDGVDEALLTAQHLVQNRHPTRSALPYLERALALDPQDSRAHLALAEYRHRRGELDAAREHLDAAEARLTRRNLNPRTGELHHRRALLLERAGDDRGARAAFVKSGWDTGYALPARLGAARAHLRLGEAPEALEQARAAVAVDPANPAARALLVLALRRTGGDAAAELAAARAADPLDPLLAALDDDLHPLDPRTLLLVAFELERSGEPELAVRWAAGAAQAGASAFGNPAPLAHYLRARILDDPAERAAARAADRRWAFPDGLDEEGVLRDAIAAEPHDHVALGLLGQLLLGARRGDEAATVLDAAVAAGSDDPVVLRSAAIAAVNARGDLDRGDALLAAAIASAGPMPRLVFERDQLARLRGVGPFERLAALEASGAALHERDDLTVVHLGLLVDAGRAEEALTVLERRRFQPFEGGEGQVLAVFDRASLAVAAGLDPIGAAALLDAGLTAPEQLGEGRHPGDPIAERLVAAGDAHAAAGDADAARERWRRATVRLDVAPRPAREDDHWVGLAHLRLGERREAEAVWADLDRAADELEAAPLAPDYFATSLPELLLFSVDDPVGRSERVARLRELAGLGRSAA
ncbi:DUF5107 domain-containing protein [Arenivirga flava]|uniref:DUF5107 domain-containing protein n=1 Tax=Arenivirga flava TaxID=1930060 RepID=A0AA37ULY8_9MICO|nr:DUF5107 domain-containing protein [Arenivirga flava]GMA27441.1 hypothetical protein GCM10025874_06940 [Arenivirga flava]